MPSRPANDSILGKVITGLKIVIHEEIYCDNRNLKKYLPARYASLVNKSYYKQIVTLVCFPVDQMAITSKNVEKVLKKIKNQNITALYFARCFTLEAIKIINEKNGIVFALVEYPWTDDRCNQVRGGT